MRVIGIRRGYSGLLARDMVEMNLRSYIRHYTRFTRILQDSGRKFIAFYETTCKTGKKLFTLS